MASSKGSERSRVTAFTLREMEKTLEGLEQRRDVIRLCFNKLALIAGADNIPQRGQGKTQSRQWLGPGGAGQAVPGRRCQAGGEKPQDKWSCFCTRLCPPPQSCCPVIGGLSSLSADTRCSWG